MNVNAQRVNPNSHLNIFKRLVQLRRTPVIRYGDLQTFAPKEWIFMFTRSVETETVAVVMNIGSETEEVCARNSATALPDTMFVYTSSMHSGFSVGSKVKISNSDGTDCVALRPFSTLVLSTNRSIPQLNSSSIISSSILIWLITWFFRLVW
nr:PREDICTED: maltase A1-like [Bemisia tabaci]